MPERGQEWIGWFWQTFATWAPLIAVVLIALVRPRTASKWFHAVERLLGKLARRPRWAVLCVALFAFALNALFAWCVCMPYPRAHDEFGYCLAADTFAHGRLANPTHPMWQHFETFHVIQQPTYASRYPPGQGMLFAAGQIIGRHPVVGLWLGAALACGAITWMLSAWMPSRWALLGGILAALHPTMFAWSQCYWGGLPAVIGGSLVIGGMRRCAVHARASDAAWMGLGMAVLAVTRPFEGAVISLIAVIICVAQLTRRLEFPKWIRLTGVILCFVLPAIAALGFYNYRVTGDALRMPWNLYQETYGTAGVFVWQPVRAEPVYRHKVMRDFHIEWEQAMALRHKTLRGFLEESAGKLLKYGRAYLHLAPLALCLIALPWVIKRDTWTRAALVGLLAFTATLLLEIGKHSHYVACGFGLAFVVQMQCARQLGAWRFQGGPSGRFLQRGMVLLCVVWFVSWARFVAHIDDGVWSTDRARIEADLKVLGANHLVIVRYAADHSPHNEWVYNEADVDHAKVVWAREMGATEDRQLINYFSGRRVWLLEADACPPRLTACAAP